MQDFFRSRIKIVCPRSGTCNTFDGKLHGRVDSSCGRGRWISKISAPAAYAAISTSTWKPRRIAEYSASSSHLCFIKPVGQDLQWSADVIKKTELCYLPHVRLMICFNVKVETRRRRRMRRTTNCDKLKISRSSRRSLRGNITIHLEERISFKCVRIETSSGLLCTP